MTSSKRQQEYPLMTKRAKSASVSAINSSNKTHADIVLVELLTPRASSISRPPSSQIGDNYKTNMLKLVADSFNEFKVASEFVNTTNNEQPTSTRQI